MRRIYKFIIAAAAALAAVPAQAALPILERTNLDFIRDAITPALRVVRSTYVIAAEDFSQEYNAEGDTVFGRKYSLAVMTPAGLITSSSAARPWDFDPDFTPYSNDAAYTPLISTQMFSTMAETPIYCPILFDEFSMSEPIPAGDVNAPFYVQQITNANKDSFINCYKPTETTRGLAVWVTAPASINLDKDTEAQIKIENATLDFDTSTSVVDIKKPSTNADILGGIFVVPVTVRPGTIEFKLAGIMAPPVGPGAPWRVIKIDLPSTAAEAPAL